MPRRVRPRPQPDLELPLGEVPPLPAAAAGRLPSAADTGEVSVIAEAFLAANGAVRERFVAGADEDMWHDSPFAWLRTLPTSRRNKAAVALCEQLLCGVGYPVAERHAPGHDVVVESRTVRVKFSTLWATGSYTFQQIRQDGFDALLLIGVSPHTAHAWLVPAGRLADYVARDGSLGLEIDPVAPPEWLGSGELVVFLDAAATLFGPPTVPHGPASVAALARKAEARTTVASASNGSADDQDAQ